MATVNLNKTWFTIKFRSGLFANILKVVTYPYEGEPLYATDRPGRLWIGDSNNIARPVQTLDMAMVSESGDVMTDEDFTISYGEV